MCIFSYNCIIINKKIWKIAMYYLYDHTVQKSDLFSSILIFAKEKFPQFIQVKRTMRAALKEYPYGSFALNNSDNLIQYKNLLNHYRLFHKNTFLRWYKKYIIYSRPRALDKAIFSKITKNLNKFTIRYKLEILKLSRSWSKHIRIWIR